MTPESLTWDALMKMRDKAGDLSDDFIRKIPDSTLREAAMKQKDMSYISIPSWSYVPEPYKATKEDIYQLEEWTKSPSFERRSEWILQKIHLVYGHNVPIPDGIPVALFQKLSKTLDRETEEREQLKERLLREVDRIDLTRLSQKVQACQETSQSCHKDS